MWLWWLLTILLCELVCPLSKDLVTVGIKPADLLIHYSDLTVERLIVFCSCSHVFQLISQLLVLALSLAEMVL